MPNMAPHQPLTEDYDVPWLGLIIGNTRLHWAVFDQLKPTVRPRKTNGGSQTDTDNTNSLPEEDSNIGDYGEEWDGGAHGQAIRCAWHTPHLSLDEAETLMQRGFLPSAWQHLAVNGQQPVSSLPGLEKRELSQGQIPALYCASVVPEQTKLWDTYQGFREVRLADLPLGNVYPTLGIDRALNVLGAGDRYGWPVLVIDAGTALTFTGGVANTFSGGAILPGLSTQLAALVQHTATLPQANVSALLPPRWSVNTPDAIRSGIIYGILATIRDFLQQWRQQHPNSAAVLTGGDGETIFEWLSQEDTILNVYQDANLTFWGLNCVRHHGRS
ncbi:pantothenate kinase [Oscillatoria sp. CS-180]|uniref:pantothenate kinase n=1 Tax=Oscillatoria sp. CS-180 TaxID=3021720 RepID=UPI00232F4550|nr:pantothenate kinase [Oscillatoria sp. CS-180]MDB9528306.1 pantothenate kinase [Oscillatoria sp. CS-180]